VSGDEYAYDLLMRERRHGLHLSAAPQLCRWQSRFPEGSAGADDAVNSLSDGGAHCGTICDAASPTFMLQHWVRDRKRGKRISLENAIKRQCRDTAVLYGLDDRGLLKPGYLADVNMIDLTRSSSASPGWPSICPLAASACCRRPKAMTARSSHGQVTFRNGECLGVYPLGFASVFLALVIGLTDGDAKSLVSSMAKPDAFGA
jgi:N-acyl-D-amino-acid deacylase